MSRYISYMTPYSFKSSLILFVLLALVTTTDAMTRPSATMCHNHERIALLEFKQSLSLNMSASYDSSSYAKTQSWKSRGKSNSDCCSWHGVECDNNTGYVIGLHLNSSFLSGPLHFKSTIFSLVHLQTLNLADNYFNNSPLPPEIFRLSSLFSLNLSYSGFSGQIPLEVSGLSKLKSLDLSVNDLSGNLPASIGNLQSLTRLKLDRCSFSGHIPTSVGNLTKLTYLSLSSNKFYTRKHFWLHKLTKLAYLDLGFNHLYGNILTSLANLTQLTVLSLENNYFTGQIPLWLTNMTSLTTLILEVNDLTGSIPSSLSQLKKLELLDVFANNLIGKIDVNIFLSLEKLISLDLSNNHITLLTHHHNNSNVPKLEMLGLTFCNLREMPHFLRFQNKLELLLLKGNNIHGKVPLWIWNSSDHLNAIDLSSNFLTAIDQSQIALRNMNLRAIDLSDNILEGSLPVPPPYTVQYSMSNNSLTGSIPPMICGCMSLKLLDLSHNRMSGPIPQCLAYSLDALVLQNNNFSGTIPQTYLKKCSLKVIDLSENKLTGKIPKSLSNCKMLQILDLSNNQMKQTFPTWLGDLPLLQVLLLHSNKFHGAMQNPRTPSEFPMLRIVDLSCNSLTGDLPVGYIQIWNAMKVFHAEVEPYIKTDVEFGTVNSTWRVSYHSSITLVNKGVNTEYNNILNILTAINLSNNRFRGQIPESLGTLEAVQLLDLSNNELTGPIPPALGNLRQLESLDLSHNKLSGFIPQQLAAQLNFLAFFNVSYNLLSGSIPQGTQFKTFSNDSYVENSGLCGLPLSKNCGTVQSPLANDDKESEDDFDEKFLSGYDWIFILAGVVSGLVVGFVMGNILLDKHPWVIRKILLILQKIKT